MQLHCLHADTLSRCMVIVKSHTFQAQFHPKMLILRVSTAPYLTLNTYRVQCWAVEFTGCQLPITSIVPRHHISHITYHISHIDTLICIPYSAKFLRIFNFANFKNFQPCAKIFQRKFLTRGVQCACAVIREIRSCPICARYKYFHTRNY